MVETLCHAFGRTQLGRYWYETKDGDPEAFALFQRHYSYHHYKDGRREDPSNRTRRLFVGPGQKLVLITVAVDALWVWRKFIDASKQQGVNCAVFRNESNHLSSELIRDAETVAAAVWPGQRLYTYVSPKRIKSSNPGYCYLRANWSRCGTTKGGLVILEKIPVD